MESIDSFIFFLIFSATIEQMTAVSLGHVALPVFGLPHEILVLAASSNRGSRKYAHMPRLATEHSLLAYTKYKCS